MTHEELKNYFQEKIDNGNNHIFTDITDYEYKTVDAINCIEKLEEENTNLKQALIDIREILGKYKHYCLPDEKQNSENEDLVERSYAIIDKVLGDDSNEEH